MNNRHHLDMNLKRLKLPGMVTNMDIRMQEAGDNDLRYLELFTLLIQDEIEKR